MNHPPFSVPSRCLVLAFALLGFGLAHAQQEDAATTDEQRDMPGTGIDAEVTGTDLDLADVNQMGNPLQGLMENWPEDLVIAPVPGYSPQLGWNMTLGAGYFLDSRDAKSDSPPSVLGGFVMGAENGSYAYGGGANLHLMDDRLRTKIGAAYMDVRYRFYGIGNVQGDSGTGIDLLQNGPLYFASASWRVWKKLYVGLGYLSGSVDSRIRFAAPDTLAFDPTLSVDIGAYTIPVQIDSRDHEQYPRNGWLVTARASLYRESAGSDFDAETLKLSANHYLPMRDQDVLASRIVVRSSSGDAPFFLLSTFGGGTDLRGYPSGRYRDRMMYALQTEYRWHVSDRWILTGFAGFGEVADSFADMGDNFLPAAGIGARFILSEKHRVSLSTDIAVGNDGAEFYFGVGEAF